jgi:hypothetical protein
MVVGRGHHRVDFFGSEPSQNFQEMRLTDQQRQAYSREHKFVTLQPGKRFEFNIRADWYEVRKCQDTNINGNDVEIDMSVNDRDFAPVKRGEPGGGVTPGVGEIWRITALNTYVNPVFFEILFGMGVRPYTPETRITNPTLALDPASILALANAILNLQGGGALKAGIKILAPGDPPFVLQNCKSIEVIADGAAASAVRIDSASGRINNYLLPTGEIKDIGCENDQDWIEDITVTPSVGCGAEITYLQVP